MSQHMDALALANKARFAQAALKREIASAPDPVATVAELLKAPDRCGSLRLDRLLGAIPRYASRRSEKLLRSVGMAQGRLIREVRELTASERQRLADALLPAPDLTDSQRDVLGVLNGTWMDSQRIAFQLGRDTQGAGLTTASLHRRDLVDHRRCYGASYWRLKPPDSEPVA